MGRDSDASGGPAGGGSDTDQGDTNGNDSVGGWEAQVAEKGYASSVGETAADADPGAMAEMAEIHGWSTADISSNLSDEFGVVGFAEAVSRYGVVEGIIGAVTAFAPEMVEAFVEFVASKAVTAVAMAIVMTNPYLAVAVLVAGHYGVGKLGDLAHDAALGTDATAVDALNAMADDMGEGSDSEMLKDIISKAGLEGVSLAAFLDLNEVSEVSHGLSRRRSNIIGTGLQGLTIE